MLDYLERARDQTRNPARSGLECPALGSKGVGASRDLRIDQSKTGEIRALTNLVMVDHVGNPQVEIEVSKARKIKANAGVGDHSRWK